MSSNLPRDPSDQQAEAELSAYSPRPPRIDRDRLMYEAGRAAAQSQLSPAVGAVLRHGVIAWFPSPPTLIPTNWLWPAATLALALVSVSLGIALLVRSGPVDREPIARRDRQGNVALDEPRTTAVSSGGLPAAALQHEPPPAATPEPVLSVDSLPEDHLLRVRQIALTEGVDALALPAGREASRMSAPPTRGTLMRSLSLPQASPAARPALFQWSSWFTSEQ
jgi:hypothetical protein